MHLHASQPVMVAVMPTLTAHQARLAGRPELMTIIGPALQGTENDP